jgi:predicted DNA-binding transcriptional regulator AlpA
MAIHAPSLTTPRAAEVLGVNASALRRWRRARKGPVCFRIGNSVRYRPTDLEAWLESQRVGPPQEETPNAQ